MSVTAASAPPSATAPCVARDTETLYRTHDSWGKRNGAHLQALRRSHNFAGLRLTQLGPGERAGTHCVLPVGRLLPLVLDGTPVDQISRMLAGKPEESDVARQSGKRKEPPTTDDDVGLPQKRRVLHRAKKGDVVFFLGDVVPHEVLRVEQRPPRVPEESTRWLVVAPLPVVAGTERELHASEFLGLSRQTFSAAWAAACALDDGAARATRQGVLVQTIKRQAGLRGTKTAREIWSVMCPEHPWPESQPADAAAAAADKAAVAAEEAAASANAAETIASASRR